MGEFFQLTVAGGSYQEGLITHLQGVPVGILLDEAEIYSDLLQRKPGQGELSSPRREPDIPVIFTGVNAADTMSGFANAGHTNGTPLTILIPNQDRHFEHIEAYRATNRTPRPGHASYATYQKYGSWDDSIGAGIFLWTLHLHDSRRRSRGAQSAGQAWHRYLLVCQGGCRRGHAGDALRQGQG